MSDESVYTVAVWGVKTPGKDYFITGVKNRNGFGVGINFAPHGLRMDMQAVVTQVLRPMNEDEFIDAVTKNLIEAGTLPEVDGPVVQKQVAIVKSSSDSAVDRAYDVLEKAGYEILIPEIAEG